MAWIKLQQTLFRHPKITKLSALMKWDRKKSCGFMAELWCWALDYAEDGDLSKFSDEEIAIAMDIDTSVAPVLVNSLVESGFINKSKQIKNWQEHAGEFLKIRYRKRQKNHSEHMGNTCATQVLHTTRQDKTRKEEIRQDKTRQKDIDLSFLENEKIKQLISRWVKYRKEIKKPIKSLDSLKTFCKKLNDMSNNNITVATKIIEQSISNQWQGIFPLKEDNFNKKEVENDGKDFSPLSY